MWSMLTSAGEHAWLPPRTSFVKGQTGTVCLPFGVLAVQGLVPLMQDIRSGLRHEGCGSMCIADAYTGLLLA